MEKGCITGTEALIRWQRSNGEMVYPDEFIPILEESGLIIPFGEWVLRKACEDMKSLNKDRQFPLNLAVNLSGVQFTDKSLVSKIMSILDETGFPPENLEVEVTESMAMKNIDNTLSVLEKLRDSRISIAVDDFGTGYSSLSYIQKFPLSTLKIDKSFIKQIPEKRSDTALVRSIISLAQVMNINVIAEGVETESQFQYLKNNNCREIQGYYISKPVSLDYLKKIL
jgi:EAL domain-containing protein (putative c-di-GMP-specific phosphodiesterase class I)